jgi:hypothetical protein
MFAPYFLKNQNELPSYEDGEQVSITLEGEERDEIGRGIRA